MFLYFLWILNELLPRVNTAVDTERKSLGFIVYYHRFKIKFFRTKTKKILVFLFAVMKVLRKKPI